jgi:outer membrane protein OmpA-like peptidoglycan-associated protein
MTGKGMLILFIPFPLVDRIAMGNLVTSVLLICTFVLSVSFQLCGATWEGRLDGPVQGPQSQPDLAFIKGKSDSSWEIATKDSGWDNRAHSMKALKRSSARAMDATRDAAGKPPSNKDTARQTPEQLIRHLDQLVRKGKLDEAFHLITKRLEEVSREDPEFFYLNLYAGEFIVYKRNMLIRRLTNSIDGQQGFLDSTSFGAAFTKHLDEHDKPNKEALTYLLIAWNNIHLVSEKDQETAEKRLTDAFFALVKPYIAHTLFGINSDKILNTWLPSLDTASILLKEIPIGKIFLEGHTDNTGSAEDNLVLSKRRAESVKKYLVSRGIRQHRITADGKGEASPIASNDTPEGRAENRRVEIVLSIRFPTR